MGVNLRPYQEDGVNGIRNSLKKNKRVLYVLATGGGKTETFIHIAERAMSMGKTVFFLVHKKNLVRQISERCKKYNLRHGIIAGGYQKQYYLPAQICSVQTLKNRLADVPVPDLIIVDEAHHSNAGTWKAILDYYSEVYTLGVTATPIRTDGQGLGDIFQDMILGPTPAELVKMGNLVMPDYYTFKNLKGLENVKLDKHGEYNKSEVNKLIEQSGLVGDAVKEYTKLAAGEPAIYSCVSIAESKKLAEKFRSAGYTSEAVHGELKDEEVERIFKGLADRSINVVTFCDLISEGTDIPAVAVVGLCRPTMSMALYLQIVGRGLRPCEGKDKCIILDHVGNIGRHKHPLTQRDWSLEGMKKKRKKKKQEEENEEYYTCESCYFVYEKSEECCPKCGLINEKKKRELKFVQGIAVKDERSLDDFLNIQQGAKVKEQKDCLTLEELWQFKERKRYQDFWVKHVFEAKVLKEVEEGNKKISNILKEILEQNKYEEYTNFNEKTHINNLKYDIESKYKLFLGSSLSETDVKAAIDKAWNSFYGLKKLNMKKSYKKSY
jgi:superfamily II DNA or RNA helicase